MKIINTISNILQVYSNGSFDLNKWKAYINSIDSNLEKLCLNDMNQVINTGLYSFKKDYLPILNLVIDKKDQLIKLENNFNIVMFDLEEKVINKFKRTIDVDIILYLGLCNGAGWVVTINNKTCCLLGIEKILELNWHDIDSLYGLIYHELGHVYQNQYGILEKKFDNNKQQFLWQLFTEGIAMYFEQTLIGDYNYYHQDKDGWKKWCDEHIEQIKKDFYNDLETMTNDDQRYFGDWVNYNDHSDVGYYLGTKFVQYICKIYDFDDILSIDIKSIEKLFKEFITA